MNHRKIFERDELITLSVSGEWTEEDLLSQEGMFYLKDIVDKLGIKPAKIIKLAKAATDPYKTMGIRKVWTHWCVRMTVFAPYYRTHLKSCIEKFDPSWHSNTMLAQSGIYLLSDVCTKIPFTTYQIRYRSIQTENAKEVMGVWKDSKASRYVVNMPVFKKWIEETWQNFGRNVRREC